jgi:hypothetical protein
MTASRLRRALPSARAVVARAEVLAAEPGWSLRIAGKARLTCRRWAEKPLALYRAEELEQMRRNFTPFSIRATMWRVRISCARLRNPGRR